MTNNYPVFALLCDTVSGADSQNLTFSEYSRIMTPRLERTVAKYLMEPLDTLNRLQHERQQNTGVAQAYMDIFKSRQAQKDTLERIFSVVEFSPTLFGIVCDMRQAVGDDTPTAEFYREKFVSDFNAVELSHFDWSENVGDIYQRLKISFLEDNMDYLEKQKTLTPELRRWSNIAQNFRTVYCESGQSNLVEHYNRLFKVKNDLTPSKTVVKMS